MRKLFPIFLALSVLFTSCGALAAADAEQEKEGAKLAASALATKEIRIEVRDIVNQLGPAIHGSGEYCLQIKNGKVTTYLPFFGTSTSSSYGSSEGGINIENCPVEIKTVKSRKAKGETRWSFSASSEREKYEFIISFYGNGSASIHCDGSSRSPMDYYGNLVPLE